MGEQGNCSWEQMPAWRWLDSPASIRGPAEREMAAERCFNCLQHCSARGEQKTII